MGGPRLPTGLAGKQAEKSISSPKRRIKKKEKGEVIINNYFQVMTSDKTNVHLLATCARIHMQNEYMQHPIGSILSYFKSISYVIIHLYPHYTSLYP